MKTVLVVDDEFAIVELLCELLTDSGYKVVTARHGKEALQQLAQVQIDVILSDVMMPIMNGSELCHAINTDYRNVPVIFTSALGDRVLDDDCKYAAFLNKPFDLDDVLDALTQVV